MCICQKFYFQLIKRRMEFFSRFIHEFDGLDMIEVNFEGETSFMEAFDGRGRIILDNLRNLVV